MSAAVAHRFDQPAVSSQRDPASTIDRCFGDDGFCQRQSFEPTTGRTALGAVDAAAEFDTILSLIAAEIHGNRFE